MLNGKRKDEQLLEAGRNTYSEISTHINKCVASLYDYNSIPLCILSHKYDKRRSKLISELIQDVESGDLDRDVYIFIYSNQEKLYQFLQPYRQIKLVYISEVSPHHTLAGKRNFVVKYMKDLKYDDIFMFEDDVFNFAIPHPSSTNSGVYKNGKNIIGLSAFTKLWEYFIDINELKTMSAALIESAAIWVDFRKTTLVRTNCACIQCIHLNLNYMADNDMTYDHDSGWDDFDMNLQFITTGGSTKVLFLMYSTVPLKGGMSTIENDNLKERCERSSNQFVSKWGTTLTQITEKRGLINARIRWVAFKNLIKKGYPLKDLIGLKREDAEAWLLNYNKNGKSSSEKIAKIAKPRIIKESSNSIEPTTSIVKRTEEEKLRLKNILKGW